MGLLYNRRNILGNIELIFYIFLTVGFNILTHATPTIFDSVAYYELLNYPKIGLKHFRVRKSVDRGNDLRLDFQAHGREFKLDLRNDNSLLSSDVLVEDDGSEKFRESNIYSGKLKGEPQSHVYGFLYEDIFEGRIHCSDGNEFQVENSKQYGGFDHTNGHSVIYNVKDLVNSGPHYYGAISLGSDPRSQKDKLGGKGSNLYEFYRTKLEVPQNFDFHVNRRNIGKRLRRSAENQTESENPKLECQIRLRADPTYVRYANNDKNRAMYLMSQHVKFASDVLESTDFDGDGTPEGYTIVIKRIGVIGTAGCTVNDTRQNCKYANERIGIAKFLDISSSEDHSEFCLSYVFAHRNFDNGVLGLAFTASAKNDFPGGICEENMPIANERKSLNTGVVSNTVYGHTVSKKETDISFAHEIAHNFGSNHDKRDDRNCVPNGPNGNYLMFSQAQYGTDENNFLLSPCSRRDIWRTLQAKSHKCFKEKGKSICGNRIVEPGEDCDCGYRDEESCYKDDPCCVGASPSGAYGCHYSIMARKVPEQSRCSPSAGECCNGKTCQPYKNNTKVCSYTVNECAEVTKCFDNSPDCPQAVARPDFSLCNGGTNVCMKGQCSGSLCLQSMRVQCHCTAEEDQCNICCREKGNYTSCEAYTPRGNTISLPIGSTCDKGNGRCNRLSVCQVINEEGIFARLQKWLFNKERFVNIYKWTKVNWWAAVLMILGLILTIIAFVWCCKRFVPSDGSTGRVRRKQRRPFLCISPIPDHEEHPRTATAPLNRSRNGSYISPPFNEPPMYDEAPPGYNTALRDNIRYPPSYELEIVR